MCVNIYDGTESLPFFYCILTYFSPDSDIIFSDGRICKNSTYGDICIHTYTHIFSSGKLLEKKDCPQLGR